MSNRSKAQILIVHDDPRTRESLGMLLMFAGYDVATAENGANALLHMKPGAPRSDRYGSQHAAHVRSGIDVARAQLLPFGFDCRDER